MRAFIRRALLDDAVSVDGLEIALLEPTGAPAVRVRFRLRNKASRPALLAFHRPANRNLTFTLTGEAGTRVTSVGSGWSVEVSATALTSVDAIAPVPSADVIIGIPLHTPQPVRAIQIPRPAHTIDVESESLRHCAVLLSRSQSAQETVHAELTVRPLSSPVLLPSAGLTATFVDFHATALSTRSQKAVLDELDLLAGQLFRVMEVAPSGTLGVLVEHGPRWRDLGAPGLLSLRAAWISDTETHKTSLLLLWQLTAVIWGGLIHVHGRESGRLVFALRLWTAVEFARSHSAWSLRRDTLFHDLTKLLKDSATTESDAQALQWYRQATVSTTTLLQSRDRHHSPKRQLQQLIAETYGCDVSMDWVTMRLRAMGLQLR